MAMTDDDKKFITSRLVLVWGGISIAALVAGLVGASLLGRNLANSFADRINTLYRRTVAPGLDTPVVLVGGSLTFRARDTGLLWVQDSNNPSAAFHVSPQYAVVSIVVKKGDNPGGDGPDPDDSTASSDKIRVTIPDGASWEVDEFIPGASGQPDQQVASIKPDPVTSYQIDLTAVTGQYLCPSGNMKSIAYSPTSSCPAPADGVTFSSISVKVTIGGQIQTWGTIKCLDATGDALGKCRIVFRGD
jgi:hypothetical protein